MKKSNGRITRIFFVCFIFFGLISCVNDSKSYYNLDNEQYIEGLENKIKKLKSDNNELEERIQELEEQISDYE